MKPHMIRTLLLSLLFALVFPSLAHGYYNPSTGRWLNRDPAKEHPGSSLYSAGKNCFINGVDLLGLQFRVVYGFAPHGTLTNPNWEGRTWLTKEESMVLVPFRSLMLGLNCATIVVMSDYEYEVTSLLPPTVPPGYTENGLWTIIAHEAKRVAVYEAAYNAYLATARATVEGKTLCCCRLSAGALIGTWAETVARKFQEQFAFWVGAQQDAIDKEAHHLSTIKVNGEELIDGTTQPYEMPEPPPVTDLDAFPTCQ